MKFSHLKVLRIQGKPSSLPGAKRKSPCIHGTDMASSESHEYSPEIQLCKLVKYKRKTKTESRNMIEEVIIPGIISEGFLGGDIYTGR